jgi:hypothetical protein
MPAQRKPSKQQIARKAMEQIRANDALRDAARRRLGTALLFWKVCGSRQCLRARACTGDCFMRLWPHVPEELKFTIHSFIRAKVPGRSRQQIDAAMKLDHERWLKNEAARSPEAEARAKASIARLQKTHAVVPAVPVPDPPRNPRLRVL